VAHHRSRLVAVVLIAVVIKDQISIGLAYSLASRFTGYRFHGLWLPRLHDDDHSLSITDISSALRPPLLSTSAARLVHPGYPHLPITPPFSPTHEIVRVIISIPS